jgi:hypothetical protein
MFAPTLLPVPIRSCLGDFVNSSRRRAILAACGKSLAILLGWMILCCGIDRYFHLPQLVRLLALLMGIAGAAWLLLPALWSLSCKPDWVAVAQRIEQLDSQFGQKLITVTSQAMSRPELRGSDQLILKLQQEIEGQLQRRQLHLSGLAPLRAVLTPWLATTSLLIVAVALLSAPSLRFAQLVRRFVAPLADVPPVTSTQLSVSPTNLDVVQSQPLTIEAVVERLGASSVSLLLSDDERGDWSRLTMTPAGAGTFRFSLAAVDRDVRYYVTGGDARTPVYTIRVQRRPAVAKFDLRYDYPRYTRLPPSYVSNDTGRMEAPVGTTATLTLTSTEPLCEATLSLGGRPIPMRSTGDPTSWQTIIEIRSNQTYTIDLLSTRRVAGKGPGEGIIRALPDLPPQARLVRGGDSLRLSPHEIVPVAYEALDDYGIETLRLAVQVNGQDRHAVPIRLWGDPRRQQDTATVDLATLGLEVGDVVGLSLVTTDTGGHEARSQPLQVLISPASVDLESYQRILELGHSTALAEALAGQLQEAAESSEIAAVQKEKRSAYLSASARRDRALGTATQTAAMLRQSLLRCVTHGSTPLTEALAAWIDQTELESSAAQESFRQSGTADGIDLPGRQSLREAVSRARQLAGHLATAGRGERAKAVLADLQNLAASRQQLPSPDESSRQRRARTLDRIREDIAAEAGQLGLEVSMPDFEARLHRLVADEQSPHVGTAPVDFAAAAQLWARQMLTNPQQRVGLEARLAAAAQAEAIRPDADLIRARDLELASRAVAAVNTAMRAPAHEHVDASTPKAVARDIALLLSGPRGDTSHRTVAGTAVVERDRDARRQLAHLAGEDNLFDSSSPTTAPGSDPVREAEGLAMQANAASAQRQYDAAARFESALAGRLRWRARRNAAKTSPATTESSEPLALADRLEHHRQAAQQEMGKARQLDDLDQMQQRISASAGSVEQQQIIADQIARMRQDVDGSFEVNSRDRATAAVLGAEEQLAAMPQVLADCIALAAGRRDAASRAAAERDRADKADPGEREAAIRAANEAQKFAKDATGRLTLAAKPLAAAPIQSMSQRLGAYSPEADSARDALLVSLVPALQSLEESLMGDDPEQVDRDAADTREAIAYSQRELAAARDQLLKRDPLVAARWFARAAAESLSSQPPDTGVARRQQAGVSQWLTRAWDQSIHRAARERLAILPSLAGVLGPATGQRNQGSQQAFPSPWAALREDGPELSNPVGDSEPPGYEQSLKLYFEALGKAQEAK